MLCFLGSPDCGVVCSLFLKPGVGDTVKISRGVFVRAVGTGHSMVGKTYRLLSSQAKHNHDGQWIPVFDVQIQEDVED